MSDELIFLLNFADADLPWLFGMRPQDRPRAPSKTATRPPITMKTAVQVVPVVGAAPGVAEEAVPTAPTGRAIIRATNR
jgi:hypothetical protein